MNPYSQSLWTKLKQLELSVSKKMYLIVKIILSFVAGFSPAIYVQSSKSVLRLLLTTKQVSQTSKTTLTQKNASTKDKEDTSLTDRRLMGIAYVEKSWPRGY